MGPEIGKGRWWRRDGVLQLDQLTILENMNGGDRLDAFHAEPVEVETAERPRDSM